MCSRYFLDADGNVIAYTFRVPVNDRIGRRYNIAPTQEAPVVRLDASGAADRRLFACGGWGARWSPGGGARIEPSTIATPDAAEAVQPTHARMRVIARPEDEETCLGGSADDARAILTPYAGPLH